MSNLAINSGKWVVISHDEQLSGKLFKQHNDSQVQDSTVQEAQIPVGCDFFMMSNLVGKLLEQHHYCRVQETVEGA